MRRLIKSTKWFGFSVWINLLIGQRQEKEMRRERKKGADLSGNSQNGRKLPAS